MGGTNAHNEPHEQQARAHRAGEDSMTAKEHREPNRVLDFGEFPGRWEITRSTEDTNGELLEMRFEIESVPEEGPFVHTHPHAEERYEVRSGVLEVYVDGDWTDVSAGEEHTVAPGTPHTFRNKTPVELINVHEPALRHEEFSGGSIASLRSEACRSLRMASTTSYCWRC